MKIFFKTRTALRNSTLKGTKTDCGKDAKIGKRWAIDISKK